MDVLKVLIAGCKGAHLLQVARLVRDLVKPGGPDLDNSFAIEAASGLLIISESSWVD